MSLEKLRQLQTEKIRLLSEERMRFYEPHPKQLKFHKSQAKIRGFWGGNQVGKTTALVAEAIWTTGKVHPYRKNYKTQVWSRICVQDFKVLDGVMIPKFKQMIPRKACILNDMKFCGLSGGSWESAWKKDNATLYFEDGSFIEFRTYEQDTQSHAGAQRHFIGFDEEPPRVLNDENLARQTTVGINACYAMTPLNYSNWIYRALYQRAVTDKDVFLITSATKDNKFVKQETIDFLEKTYTDPTERAARLLGKPSYLEGLVYKEYGDHNLVDPEDVPTQGVKYSVVIDPHEQKATAWNLFAESTWEKDGVTRLYCIAEGDVEGDVEYICNSIFSQLDNRPISLWLCDPSARRRARIRGHEESMINEFRRFIPQLIEANNSLDVGITRMRSAIKPFAEKRKPKFLVSRACPMTDHQLRNYSWKPPLKSGENRTKAAVTLRENDHPDICRYYTMHQPTGDGVEIESFGINVYGK